MFKNVKVSAYLSSDTMTSKELEILEDNLTMEDKEALIKDHELMQHNGKNWELINVVDISVADFGYGDLEIVLEIKINKF